MSTRYETQKWYNPETGQSQVRLRIGATGQWSDPLEEWVYDQCRMLQFEHQDKDVQSGIIFVWDEKEILDVEGLEGQTSGVVS